MKTIKCITYIAKCFIFALLLILMACSCRKIIKGETQIYSEKKAVNDPATVIPVPRTESDMNYVKPIYEKINGDLNGGIDLAKVKVLFIGNSITQKWQVEGGSLWKLNFSETTSPYYTLNLGVPGDRTQHILYRILPTSEKGLGNIDNPSINPRVIVLEIGTNNLWSDQVPDIVLGIKTCAEKLLTARPNSKLIITTVPPVSDVQINKKVDLVNKALLGNLSFSTIMANKITILDINSGMKQPDGTIHPDYFYDGVHFTEKGYQHWLTELIPKLDVLLTP